MNSSIKTYAISWTILVAAFNVIVFVAPGWTGAEKYTGSFWIGYAFTTVAMIAHILITIWAFKDADGLSRKLFYNLPIIYIGYSAMIVSIIVGALCMLNSNLPAWIAIVVSILLFVFYSGAILRTRIAVNAIEAVDNKVKTQTSFIRDLTARASALKSSAKTEEAKATCDKVYEALRYSDPVSSDSTADIEKEIEEKFDEFAQAVKNGDEERVSEYGERLYELVGERKNY